MTRTRHKSTDLVLGALIGGALFIGASWFLHCRLGMGPWYCQRHKCDCEKKQ